MYLDNQLEKNEISPSMEVNGVQLSKRQCEVLFYLVRGKTAKSIGKKLNISQRTVEQHLENIKIKMNVYSKAALIEKMIDYFI